MPVIVLSIPRMDLLIIAKPLNERMQDRKCQRENRVALPSSLPPPALRVLPAAFVVMALPSAGFPLLS